MNKFVFVILAFVAVLTYVSSSSATTACATGEHSAVISRVCTGQLGGTYSNADGNTPCCTYTGSGSFQIYPNRLCATSTSNTDFQRSEIQEFCEDGGNVYSCNNFANKGSQINCGASAVAEGTLDTTYPGRHFPQPTRSNSASAVAASPSSAATASPVSNSTSISNTSAPTGTSTVSNSTSTVVLIQTLLSATGSPVSQTGSPNVSVSLSGSANVSMTAANTSSISQTIITQSGSQVTGTANSSTLSAAVSPSGSNSAVASPTGSLSAAATATASNSSSIVASLTATQITGTNGSNTAASTGTNSSSLSAPVSVSANTTDTPPY